MIKLLDEDIFNMETEAIVNPVNCVGVMGAGLALQFKIKYPENFINYKKSCYNGNIKPGSLTLFSTGKEYPKYIINFPTKRHWSDKSRIDDINIGLETLNKIIDIKQIKSISIPHLGCGFGGLTLKDVYGLIIKNLKNSNCEIYLVGRVQNGNKDYRI